MPVIVASAEKLIAAVAVRKRFPSSDLDEADTQRLRPRLDPNMP